jgi:hypothetical protein
LPGDATAGPETRRPIMETKQGYFDDLNRLLAAMPPGQIDMRRIEANEQRHGHRFYDPPETVYRWLLDQQLRILSARPG